MDKSAFFNLSYGLYIASTCYEGKQYGCVLNTMSQVTSSPAQISLALNKENATTQAIISSGVFSGVVLCEETPMETIGTFGFQSSKDTDKFAAVAHATDKNGVAYPTAHISSQFSCRVVSTLDIGTHMLIIGEVEDCQVLSGEAPMTYAYYHKVKKGQTPPKASSYQAPEPKAKGYRCTICGYIYEGEPLPEDFVCPVCHQPASVFEKIEG